MTRFELDEKIYIAFGTKILTQKRSKKREFSDGVFAEVFENMKNVLQLNGIESTIANQYLSLGIGGIDCSPELWVAERDVERALD